MALASDKPECDCNLLGRFLSSALGGILGFTLGRILEKCYLYYYERRYVSANAATGGYNDDIHTFDDQERENTLYLPFYNTTLTMPGHGISDMDRDVRRGRVLRGWTKTTLE